VLRCAAVSVAAALAGPVQLGSAQVRLQVVTPLFFPPAMLARLGLSNGSYSRLRSLVDGSIPVTQIALMSCCHGNQTCWLHNVHATCMPAG
jgi:hypothetical protein